MRATQSAVELLFERAVPLLGRAYRTKFSQAGEPPYLEMRPSPDGKRVSIVDRKDPHTEVELTTPMMLRDMYHFLSGVVFADRHIKVPQPLVEAPNGSE